MYFNSNDNGTNIDPEFSSKKETIIDKKKIFIILGVILFLIIVCFIALKFSSNRNKKYEKFLILNGNSDVIVYQNSEFIDPGFKAYDSKGKNLTSEVATIGEVDSSVIGEYVIGYYLDDIIKERIVSVVSKPEQLTYLLLNGDSIVYQKVGSNYEEPGYVVIDSVNASLKDKVTINGNVDNNTPGTYKIIYSVINASGVTISAERIIIVTDSSLSFKYSPSEYTTGNIIINGNVMDNYFDYVILPNGTKTQNRNFEYTVSENGTYKFALYSKDGYFTEKEVVIDKIDRINPSISSCKVTIDDTSSTIKVSASDNEGIKSYTYYSNNEILSTNKSNSYKVNNTNINNITVTVSDNAGNTANKDCSINYAISLKANVNEMAKYLNSVSQSQIVTFSHGKILGSYTYGCDKNTKLYLSAGSKTILGLAAAHMEQDKIVSLDENIEKYWYRSHDYDYSTCTSNWQSYIGSVDTLQKNTSQDGEMNENDSTLRHFLTHSSTIYNLNMVHMVPGDTSSEYFGGGLSKTYARASFMLRHTWGQLFERHATPGVKTEFNYLNDGLTREHAVVGFTLQIAMKETIDEYLKNKVWNKVGGASSNPSFDMGNSIYFATSYKSSAEDVAKLIAAVANDGVYQGKTIFSKNAVNQLEKVETNLANQTIAFNYINGKYVKYGLYSNIVNVDYYKLHSILARSASFISYDPKTTNGFVVIVNFNNDNAKKSAIDMFNKMSNYFYSN